MKIRLIKIKDFVNQGQICGKFVIRCIGCSSYSPFVCEQCGLAITSSEIKFCSGYCSWEYYGKPKFDTWSM